jgi:hypothetical protein
MIELIRPAGRTNKKPVPFKVAGFFVEDFAVFTLLFLS